MKNRNIMFATVVLGVVCFWLAPGAQAVSPPPDGGYPGENTAEGEDALFSLTTNFDQSLGRDNTAIGFQALYFNTIGFFNTANGFRALFNNTTGFANTATGLVALFSNTTGNNNTADGAGALRFNTTGLHNTAIGFEALSQNTGNDNTALGNVAGRAITTGSSNIDIGNEGVATDANTIRIGEPFGASFQGSGQTRTFIAGIYGVNLNITGPGPVHSLNFPLPVMISESVQLGTTSSSRRFKKEIKPMAKASEAILDLKPVTFQYKNDNTGAPQFGLIAEDWPR